MNAKTLEAITKHGQTLLAAFPNSSEKDPVALCKKLRRIEVAVQKPILDYTNGENGMTQDKLDHELTLASIRLCNLLGADSREAQLKGVFINRDPRGYALKIDNEATGWFMAWQRKRYESGLPALHTDMGGYGIIAPDLTA